MKVNLCADFETTTDPNDCRVWAWGLAYIDYPDTVEIDNSIESFIERIQNEDSIIYFHNLKFDGIFILVWLMTNGYSHSTADRLRPYKFKTLISKMGHFYSIEVLWGNGTRTQFRDSLKKLPFSVAVVAESFGMKMMKGEIDYHKFRPIGYEPDEQERGYVHNDVSIMANAMHEVLNQGMVRLTVGSDALKEYKSIMGKRYIKKFPILDSDIDREIRSAYRGGFTYADERHRGIHHKTKGVVLDVNSLYPYVMRYKMLPYGEPVWHAGLPNTDKLHPLTIFSVTFTAKLKPDHIPTIQLKGVPGYRSTEYQKVIDDPVTISVTNVDWDLMNTHYDIEVIEYNGGYTFKAETGLFDKYIDKWSRVKENTLGGQRQLAKLYLNALYGKFATNPDITGKMPTLQDGVVKLIEGPAETRDPVYTAMGVFITAYARTHTIQAAQANYDSFAYADTDSLHLLRETVPETLDVHPTKLGAWKHEYNFTEAIFMRAKAYMELRDSGKIETHIAGLPTKIADTLNFSDVYDGHQIAGKLVPRNVPGGVVLMDTTYELKLT